MKVLIVEPDVSGHHAFYLRMILRAFEGHECWVLTCPVPEDQASLITDESTAGVNRVETPDRRPGATIEAAVSMHQRERFDVVFFAFIDPMLPVLAGLGGRPFGRVAGIWMSAGALDRRYRGLPPIDKRAKTYGRVHRWLRRPATAEWVHDLFFLVQHDADQLGRVAPAIRGHFVNDPPEAVSTLGQDQARRRLGLPEDQRILLHPGSPERRKGFGTLLDAYARLAARGLEAPFLYRVGPDGLKRRHREQLKQMINAGQAAAVHRYVPTADLADAFAACDWVAMPYRKFRHSSGILGLARVANRPVLAPDYGHIAQQVRSGQPGRLYRHGSTKDLARVVAALEAEDASSTSIAETAASAHAARAVEAEHDAFIANLSGWIGRIEQEISG